MRTCAFGRNLKLFQLLTSIIVVTASVQQTGVIESKNVPAGNTQNNRRTNTFSSRLLLLADEKYYKMPAHENSVKTRIVTRNGDFIIKEVDSQVLVVDKQNVDSDLPQNSSTNRHKQNYKSILETEPERHHTPPVFHHPPPHPPPPPPHHQPPPPHHRPPLPPRHDKRWERPFPDPFRADFVALGNKNKTHGYCPSFCASDHTWFPARNCVHPTPLCCYVPHKRLHCCNKQKDSIDTSEIGENYQCPSQLVRWWNDWWPVVLGVILSVAMVALVVSVGVCIFQVIKGRRRPVLRRSHSVHSTHSFYSECSACQNTMQMEQLDVVDETASQDTGSQSENGESNRDPECQGQNSPRRTIFVLASNDQGHSSNKALQPPPYEEIEPPPAYEP